MSFDLDRLDTVDTEKFLKIALEGLELIGALVGGGLVGKAAGTLAAVRVVIDAVQGAYDGQITSKKVEEEFAKLAKTLEANNARADAALAAKFDTSDTE